jgi:hypothetical protein
MGCNDMWELGSFVVFVHYLCMIMEIVMDF